MINKIKNRPLSILLCLTLFFNYSYMPYASAEENPEIPVDPSNVRISESAIQKIENVQILNVSSIDIKPTKKKAGLKEKELAGKGPSIAAVDNKSVIFNLEAKPAHVQKSKWRKKSISLAKSPKDLLRTSESKELKKLEEKRKKRKESFKKELDSKPARASLAATALSTEEPVAIDSNGVSPFTLLGETESSSDSRIVATPEYLVFHATDGSADPISQTFYISNGGTGTLNYTASEGGSWFDISGSSGSVTTDKATITVTVNPAGLTSGGSPYIEDITISNSDIPEDTKKVRVRVTVLSEDAYIHGYEYDSNGNITRKITPNGDIIEYTYIIILLFISVVGILYDRSLTADFDGSKLL